MDGGLIEQKVSRSSLLFLLSAQRGVCLRALCPVCHGDEIYDPWKEGGTKIVIQASYDSTRHDAEVLNQAKHAYAYS